MSDPDIAAAELGFPTHISKEAINKLPLRAYKGEVEVIRDPARVATAVGEITRERLVGFDTESRPAFRKGESYPPALLQFAGAEKAWLFQLRHLPEGIDWIAPVLGSSKILKVGVALHEDIRRLKEEYDFKAKGFVELGDFTQKVGIVNTGLRSLAGIFLHFRISKGAQVSNWNRNDLTEAQIRYAATDAWVARELYIALDKSGVLQAAAEADKAAKAG